MKKLIQLTLATVFVVITVLTVNINQADAAVDCGYLQAHQSCTGSATQGEGIIFTAVSMTHELGAKVEAQGSCNFTIYVPSDGHGPSYVCIPPVSGPYTITNNGPDSVYVHVDTHT